MNIVTTPNNDLTSPEACAETLRLALRQAHLEKREAVMRFAAGFSHDMNNLLTPILAYGSMIKEDLPPGDEAVEFIQEILDAAEKTQQLVRTMQDIRAKGVVSGATSVNEAVAVAVAEFRAGLPQIITLNHVPDSTIGETRGEPIALRRVVRELLKNAVTAMPVGGEITVATRVEVLPGETELAGDLASAGPYFVISVRDQGIGMADEIQHHIYEPYFTKWPTGQSKGLGLAIASGLIRKCGGFIRCTSAIGAGTTFDVLLKPAA